ncbi:MAG: flagellar hook-length control protein FliK [bacterium]|nr:flagellar hook-length control protein FliK [bacterium]
MNITLLPVIDQKLNDFKLTPELKIGTKLEGVVEEVLDNKTYLFKLKGFTFRARSPLDLKKHDRIQVEVRSLEPKIVLRLLPFPGKTNLPETKKTNPFDTNSLTRQASYFNSSDLSSLGMNNLAVKTFKTDEEVSPEGIKTNYQAMDILLEMSEMGKVLVRITHQSGLSYYQIVVEDKNIKEFVEENLSKLLTDLRNAGYLIPQINCTVNPNLKDSVTRQAFDPTLSKTEKGYSRFDEIA